jgi:hypothetical protein
VGFDMTLTIDQIFFLHFLEQKWEYSETVCQLFIFFKKTYDSARGELLYNNLIEFGVPMKLVGLSKMCLNETYNEVHRGRSPNIVWSPNFVHRGFRVVWWCTLSILNESCSSQNVGRIVNQCSHCYR